MRVVVPFTTLAPGVAAALDATGWLWESVYVGASDEDYWDLLASLWADGDTFAIVEHDVLVEPGTLDELNDCSSQWCGFAVPYFNGPYPGLACAKFGSGLIGMKPNALQEVAAISDPAHPPKHWCRLDAWLQYRVLPATGARRCIHPQILGHVRPHDGVPRPSHGCA